MSTPGTQHLISSDSKRNQTGSITTRPVKISHPSTCTNEAGRSPSSSMIQKQVETQGPSMCHGAFINALICACRLTTTCSVDHYDRNQVSENQVSETKKPGKKPGKKSETDRHHVQKPGLRNQVSETRSQKPRNQEKNLNIGRHQVQKPGLRYQVSETRSQKPRQQPGQKKLSHLRRDSSGSSWLPWVLLLPG